jgi:hypothetical protein
MNLALINPKVWLEIAIIAVLAGAGWYGYNWIYERGAATVQAKWNAERLQITQQSAQITADALSTTKALQDASDKQREVSNAQIASLNRSLATAIAGLSDRPARPGASGVPGDTSAGAGCYPSQLYREDSAVALKLAGEADLLRVALNQCQTQYKSAVEALK